MKRMQAKLKEMNIHFHVSLIHYPYGIILNGKNSRKSRANKENHTKTKTNSITDIYIP